MTSSTKLLTAALVAATVTVAPAAQAVAPATAGKVVAASLHTAPSVGRTPSPPFRTDHEIGRKQNGTPLDGSASFLGGPVSIGHAGARRTCYVGYVTAHAKVGGRHTVTFRLGQRTATRTLTLTRGDAAADRGVGLGC